MPYPDGRILMRLRKWHLVFLLCTLLMVSLPGGPATGQTTETTGFGNLQEDLAAGLITLDQYVIFGIQALITPLAPPRYVPLGLDDDLAMTFLRHWNEVTPATRAEVLDLFERSRGEEFLPRADSLDPVTLAAVAQTCLGFDVFIDLVIDCTYTTEHFEINYSVWGLFAVPPEGAEVDGVPDYVENVGENLESSWTVYRGLDLDYDYPEEKLPIKVRIGLDPLFAGGGLVLPDQTIRLSNVEGDTYLPRHELFHVLQYEYGGTNEFVRGLWASRPGTLWWMEATAEWAAHKASPDEVEDDDEYASRLPDFLGFPDLALDAVAVDLLFLDVPNPQYGSFIFAEHLEERIDNNVIKQIFERTVLVPEFGALEAMEVVLVNRSTTLSEELVDFARRSYLMIFQDGDADDWRVLLDDEPRDRTDADALGGGRPFRQRPDLALDVPVSGTLTVEPGGRAYIDFARMGNDEGILHLAVEGLGGDVYAEVFSFEDYPIECEPPVSFPSGAPPVEVAIVIDEDCPHATLAVTHTDPVQGSTADLAWEAMLSDELGLVNSFPKSLQVDGSDRVRLVGESGGAAFAARYQSNGSVDWNHGLTQITPTQVGANTVGSWASAQTSGGNLYIAGGGRRSSTDSDMLVMAVDSSGDLVTTFSGDGIQKIKFWGPGNWGYGIAEDLNGRIVVGGDTWSSQFHENAQIALARLNTDGSLDTSFGTGGKVTTPLTYSRVMSLAIDSQNRIVAVGEHFDQSISNWKMVVLRYLPSGSLDSTFAGDGTFDLAGHKAFWVAIDDNDRPVVGGQQGSNAPMLLRLTAAGALDTTFDDDGFAETTNTTTCANHGAIDASGRIILVGCNPAVVIAYLSDGTLDPTFGSGGVADSGLEFTRGNWVAIDSSDRIVVSGWQSLDATETVVMRFTTSGVPDTTFSGDGVVLVR